MKKSVKKNIKKKRKNQKILKNKMFWAGVIILGLIILGLIFTFYSGTSEKVTESGSLAESSLTDEDLTTLREFLNNPIVQILAGNPGRSVTEFRAQYESAGTPMPLGDVSVLIIHLVFWFMLAFAFEDIFEAFLPFQGKYAPWALGIGLTIIVANLGLIPFWLLYLAKWTAQLGAASIFISMIIAFISFIAVTFFGNWLKVSIIKRKIHLTGAVGAAAAAQAIRDLKEIENSMGRR